MFIWFFVVLLAKISQGPTQLL